MFILTIDYNKNFTTSYLLTIGHVSMCVVKSIVIHISNGLGYGSTNEYALMLYDPDNYQCPYHRYTSILNVWAVPQLSIMIIITVHSH